MMSICPPTSAASDGAEPVYGICSMSSAAADFSISDPRLDMLPVPLDP
jgi:hypothetical protein